MANEALFTYLSTFKYLGNEKISQIRKNFPWMEQGRYFVLKYVWSLLLGTGHGVLADITCSLDQLVSQNKSLIGSYFRGGEISQDEQALLDKIRGEIFEKIDTSVHQEFHKVLTTPKLHLHLSDKHNSVYKPKETLLCFINFVIELLYHVAYRDKDEVKPDNIDKHRYAFLRKDLIFLSTILGDTTFQFPDEIPQVNILLAEIEKAAIQVGSLVYSCLFEDLTPALFDERIDAMAENIRANFVQHWIELSELPRCVSVSRTNPIDAVYIIESLHEDLERLITHGFNFITDAMLNLIKSLQDELNLFRFLLRNLGVPQEAGKSELTDFVIEVRDASYEIEYLINSFVEENIPIWYLNLRLPSVICKIKFTRTKLQEFSKIDGSSKATNYSSYIQAPSSLVTNDLVVGFKDNRTMILVDLIRGESKSLRVVSIVGMPGLGKTTIATKLYHDPSICNFFDRHGWCVVSQAYDRKRVLIEILTSISGTPANDNIWKMDCENLGLQIHKTLSGRRYFIVIDDMWESRSWDDLRTYFPDNGKGSRILLTSRVQNVVPIGAAVHPLPLLSEIQAWELLKDKVFAKKTCPSQLLGIGKALAAYCRGLPLAIVVVAGILTNVEKEESAWEKVKKNLDVYMLDDDINNGYRKILELSYENLPNHLKLCFLYLGVFPEDSEIQARNLIRMWTGEGFIQKTKEKNLEDTAEGYLVELISRNLLIVTRRRFDGGIKACIFHDLLRDMCLKRAEEENFMKSIKGDEVSIFEMQRRLSVPSTSGSWRYLGQHCRTFVGHVPKSASCFSQMTLLRTLNSQLMKSKVLEIETFDVPATMRYLSLICGQMPNFMHQNFANLEFFDIDGDHTIFYIPPVLLKMVKLRYVRIRRHGEFAWNCNSSQTNNLEYFSTIRISNENDVKILKCSPHLRRIKCESEGPAFTDYSIFTKLKSLTISSYHGFIDLNFPLNITKLHLKGLCLSVEKVSMIGGLPKLHVLKLSDTDFVGHEWITREDEFMVLRFLRVSSPRLKQWKTSSDHFPELQSLVLRLCFRLEDISSDFGDHVTLKTIEVRECNEKADEFAALVEKEQHENGNEEFKITVITKAW